MDNGSTGRKRDEEHGTEPSLFLEPGEGLPSWFVLHTKSRQEKAVVADLDGLRVGCYLPLETHVRIYGNRKVRVTLPLFPGYVFARGDLEQLYVADRIKRLVGIIPVKAQQQLNWELKNLNLALSNEVKLAPYRTLKVGTRVEVRAGTLRGLQGLVEKQGQSDRLILQVEMLGRALSLEIEASLLDPV